MRYVFGASTGIENINVILYSQYSKKISLFFIHFFIQKNGYLQFDIRLCNQLSYQDLA